MQTFDMCDRLEFWLGKKHINTEFCERTIASNVCSELNYYGIMVLSTAQQLFLINLFPFFADRETERRDTADDGANAASSAEPSVTQTQQQTIDSDTTRRVTPLPDLIPVTDNISAPSEAPIPPPRRVTPSDGVRPPRPPPRRPRRRRSTCCDDKTPVVPTDHRTSEDWQSIGKQLRKIADSFRGSGLEVGELHTTVFIATVCMSCIAIQRMKCL